MFSIAAFAVQLFTLASIATSAHALVVVAAQTPVSIHSPLPKPDGCSDVSRATVSCAKIREAQSTYLCVFECRISMNLALGRVSTYLEEGEKMLNHEKHLKNPFNFANQGHNISGRGFLNFYERFAAKKFKDPVFEGDLEKLKFESEFWDAFLLPLFLSEPDAMVLAVALDSSPNTISHEFLHARFFENERFRECVLTFWKTQVQFSDRREVLKAFSAHYDVGAEKLVADEFQAYVLEKKLASRPALDAVLTRYRAPLEALCRPLDTDSEL